MEEKEQLYSNIKESLYGQIPTDEISKVVDIVASQLVNYDIVRKSTELVVYDFGDAELLKKFFIAKATEGLSERSLVSYKHTLGLCLRKIGKHIRDITTEDIRVLLAYYRINNRSTAYQNFVRRVFNSFYNWAVREKLLQENPVLRIPCIRQQLKLKLAFTEEDLEKLRDNAGSLRNEAMIEFLFSTACRVSEMTQLNRDDIDFENNQCQVLGKGNKYRMVYFSYRCNILLKKYLDSRTDDNEALFVSDYSAWKGGGMPAYRKELHTRLSKDSINQILHKIGKRAGVSDVHCHRFRRTAATLALKRGMKITDVQRMLGHSDITTTTIYALSNDEEVKREHEKYLN